MARKTAKEAVVIVPEEMNDMISENSDSNISSEEKLNMLVVAEEKNAAEAVRKSAKGILTIHNQGGEVGDEPVFIAVCGMGYSIPREKMVKVPMPIIAALEDARETRYYRAIKDGLTTGPIIERQVPRFAYTVHQRNIIE